MPKKAEETKEEESLWDYDELEGDEFDATVVSSYIEEREDRNGNVREYWIKELEVPFSPEPIEIRMTNSNRKRSLKGETLRRLKQLGVTITKPEDLNGQRFRYERVDLQFGDLEIKAFPMPKVYYPPE